MTFELRTYVAKSGRIERLLARFRTDSIRILERHNIRNVGHWVTTASPAALVYIVKHEGDPAANWAAFYADPEWIAIVEEADRNDDRNVETIESVFMQPTDFSPVQ